MPRGSSSLCKAREWLPRQALSFSGARWCTVASYETDGVELLAACGELDLEGLVAKRCAAPTDPAPDRATGSTSRHQWAARASRVLQRQPLRRRGAWLGSGYTSWMRSMLSVLSVSFAIVAAACSGSAPQGGSRAVAVDTPACERLAEIIATGLPVEELAAGKLDRLWVDVKARATVIDAAPSAEIPLGAPSVGNAEPGRRTVFIAGESRATVDELRRILDREAGERDLRITGEVRQGDPGQLVAFDVSYVDTAGHTGTFSARSCSNGVSRVAVEHPVREDTVGRCMEDRFAGACRAVLAELEATSRGLRRSPLDREDAITLEVLADGRVAGEHRSSPRSAACASPLPTPSVPSLTRAGSASN